MAGGTAVPLCGPPAFLLQEDYSKAETEASKGGERALGGGSLWGSVVGKDRGPCMTTFSSSSLEPTCLPAHFLGPFLFCSCPHLFCGRSAEPHSRPPTFLWPSRSFPPAPAWRQVASRVLTELPFVLSHRQGRRGRQGALPAEPGPGEAGPPGPGCPGPAEVREPGAQEQSFPGGPAQHRGPDSGEGT